MGRKRTMRDYDGGFLSVKPYPRDMAPARLAYRAGAEYLRKASDALDDAAWELYLGGVETVSAELERDLLGEIEALRCKLGKVREAVAEGQVVDDEPRIAEGEVEDSGEPYYDPEAEAANRDAYGLECFIPDVPDALFA